MHIVTGWKHIALYKLITVQSSQGQKRHQVLFQMRRSVKSEKAGKQNRILGEP